MSKTDQPLLRTVMLVMEPITWLQTLEVGEISLLGADKVQVKRDTIFFLNLQFEP